MQRSYRFDSAAPSYGETMRNMDIYIYIYETHKGQHLKTLKQGTANYMRILCGLLQFDKRQNSTADSHIPR